MKTQGYDSIHTIELPIGNETDDQEVIRIADHENRIVISKDRDFIDDHILNGKPPKLLAVKTGNIRNNDLIYLFEMNMNKIEELFTKYNLIELTWENLVVHG